MSAPAQVPSVSTLSGMECSAAMTNTTQSALSLSAGAAGAMAPPMDPILAPIRVNTSLSSYSVRDFDEQIRSLEAEGNKLMAATANLGDSLLTVFPPKEGSPRHRSQALSSPKHATSPKRVVTGSPQAIRTSPGSLSALADFSEEQRTITQLRASLEAQSRETQRLQQSLSQPSTRTFPGELQQSTTRGSLLSSLDIPSASHLAPSSSSFSSRPAYDLSNATSQSHLERQLKVAQEELTDLRSKLREAVRISEDQKLHFRSNLEDLRLQLQQVMSNRDQVLQIRSQENTSHETTVGQLQARVQQMEEANKIQEQAILELTSKLEVSQRDQYAADTLAAQIRSMLLDQEHKRGRPYYEAETVQRQSSSLLAHSLERCIQELETKAEAKNQRLDELSKEVEAVRGASQERIKMLNQEHQERVNQVTVEHERELSAFNERVLHARKQAATLQEQFTTLQSQSEGQVKVREETISNLEARVKHLTEERDDMMQQWKDKTTALQLAMDQVQKEFAEVRTERDDAAARAACAEMKVEQHKDTISQLEANLEKERDSLRMLISRNDTSRNKAEQMAALLEQKAREVQQLEKSIDALRAESDRQLQCTVQNVEREEKERNSEQVRNLQDKLAVSTEKVSSQALELDIIRTEHMKLKEHTSDVEARLTEARMQCESMNTVKDELSSSAQERLADIERLTQERDYYFKLLGDKDKELTNLRGDVQRLTIQNEERDKSHTALREQRETLNDTSRTLQQENKTLKEENVAVLKQLADKTSEAEDLRQACDNVTRKLHVREKYASDVEDDNSKLAEALQLGKVELEQVIKEKDEYYEEVRRLEFELSTVVEDRDRIQTYMAGKEVESKKDVGKISSKLKRTEHELHLTSKSLKSYQEMDGKAVKVADKMQRDLTQKRSQVDALQSRLHWMEEALETAIKQKKSLHVENERMVKSVKKSAQQAERLTAELEAGNKRQQKLRDRIAKLEAGLEKAALKHASTQALLEQGQQDTARLKLKHQLELKELERNGRVARAAGESPLTQASAPNVTVPATIRPGLVKPIGETISTTLNNAQVAAMLNPAAMEGGVSPELWTMLEEIRNLLSKQQHTGQPTNIKHGSLMTLEDSDSEITLSLTPKRVKPQHRKPAKATNRVVSTAAKRYSQFQMSSSPIKSTPQRLTVPESDISEIPLCGDMKFPPEKDSSMITSINMDSMMPSDETLSTPLDVQKVDAETNDLCKRLEAKIEALTQMGSELEEENKEFNRIMKSQDQKLKKVWQNEKCFKNLIKK